MFMQKHFTIRLLAAIAVQVFLASAKPIGTVSKDDFRESAAKNEESRLVTRGMFDFVPNPMNMLSSGVKTVDDNLRTVKATGINTAKNTVGSGMQLATGVNPIALMNLPNEIAKKTVRGAKIGTDAAFIATENTLEGVHNLHDRKKYFLEDYVKPVAPTIVGNAIDTVNDSFDSTMDSMKERVKNGHASAIKTLENLEDRLERGSSIVPASVTQGIASAGRMLSPSAWLGGLGFGSSDASNAADDVAQEMAAPVRAAKKVADAATRPARSARQALAKTAKSVGGRSSWFS